MENIVFDIQRFCVNDGPGIRTTVFLKGCMLNCLWCHNPESKSNKPVLMFNNEKCIGCNSCVNICECHKIGDDNNHLIDRSECILCGKCVNSCVGALSICGKVMSANEVIEIVLKDKEFYENSNGGLTISGGDPLYNYKFTKELLELAKKHNIHTTLETSGYCKWDNFIEIIPLVDLFLFDIKETNTILHHKYTGVDNELILYNLSKLNQIGKKIIMRCPIIPGYNDRIDHFMAIGSISNNLENVIKVEILPYHPLGKSKSALLGEEYMLGDLTFVDEKEVSNWIDLIQKNTNKPVTKA